MSEVVRVRLQRVNQNVVINTITECGKCVGKGLCVVFLWTSDHMGFLGTDRADKIAKEAVKRSTVQRGIQLSMSKGKSNMLKKSK